MVGRAKLGGGSCRGLLLITTFFCGATSAVATQPIVVDFDTSETVAVDDVTTPEFAAASPNERLVMARFDISSLIRRGSDEQLVHFLYRIEVAEPAMSVFDYLPKTELASSVSGNVSVEQKASDSTTLGGTLGGAAQGATAAINLAKTIAAHGQVRYELLPPKELIAAAGTIRRQHGVYFKLKPSQQTSLEGAKQFVCVFRVPKTWRGDRVMLVCEATTQSAPLLGTPSQDTLCGRGSFLVGLYRAGDIDAQKAVLELVRTEDDWLRRKQQFNQRASGDPFRVVKRRVARAETAITALWRDADGEKSSTGTARKGGQPRDWPQPLVDAEAAHAAARSRLAKLNRGR